MNNESRSESKRFSIVRRAESFTHAYRGIGVFLRSTHNAWIHGVVFSIALFLGLYLEISRTDWIALLITSALVFITEAINTAIEIDINLTSPEYHPYAKDTKDVAAGAVLIASSIAVVVGIFIFAPYL